MQMLSVPITEITEKHIFLCVIFL